MRFAPARAHGFPRPGWYEVVVRFDFDPDGATRL
jgi:hypothetical protein